MEPLFIWVQQVTNGTVTKEMLMNLQWIDWVAVGFVIVGFFAGAKQGLMREMALILESFVMIYLVFNFYGVLSTLCVAYLPKLPPMYVDPVVYLLLLVIIFFVIFFWDSVLKKMIHTQVTGILRVSGGALLGMVHSLVILSILCQFLLLIPARPIRDVFTPGNSVFGHTVASLSHDINDGLRSALSLSFLKRQETTSAITSQAKTP